MSIDRKSSCRFALYELDDAISNINDLMKSFEPGTDNALRVYNIRCLVEIVYELLDDLDLD